MSLDASTVDLVLSMFDWAKFRQTKGAVKLHLLLDHDGYLPSFAIITTGKSSDITVARRMHFDPGTILAIDRGYIDYDWFAKLTLQNVFFVTRLKDNAVYEVVEDMKVPKNRNVLKDQIVFFPGQKPEASEEYFFRLVEIWDEEKQQSFVFLTNNKKLGAATIAAIYKERWQVELFFKALKQNLKIKTFLGTSANAVWTQIWTALIAILVLKYLQMMSTFAWSLSNLVALLRQQLFVYRDLWIWLNSPFEGPPAIAELESAQLSLGLSR